MRILDHERVSCVGRPQRRRWQRRCADMRNAIRLVHVDEIIATVLLGCEAAFAISLHRAFQEANRRAARDIIESDHALPGIRNQAFRNGGDHVISGEALAYRRHEFRPLVSGGSAVRLTRPFHLLHGRRAPALEADSKKPLSRVTFKDLRVTNVSSQHIGAFVARDLLQLEDAGAGTCA